MYYYFKILIERSKVGHKEHKRGYEFTREEEEKDPREW